MKTWLVPWLQHSWAGASYSFIYNKLLHGAVERSKWHKAWEAVSSAPNAWLVLSAFQLVHVPFNSLSAEISIFLWIIHQIETKSDSLSRFLLHVCLC